MPPPDPEHAKALATRLRKLRLTKGLTQTHIANQCGVRPSTVRVWESGSSTPKPWRIPTIAAALGVPVVALFVDDGWAAVTDVVLTPEAVARVRSNGAPEAERLAQLVAAQLPALILEACRKPRPVKKGSRAKPRRTRAEVLAGIAQANEMRAARQTEARPGLGPPEG